MPTLLTSDLKRPDSRDLYIGPDGQSLRCDYVLTMSFAVSTAEVGHLSERIAEVNENLSMTVLGEWREGAAFTKWRQGIRHVEATQARLDQIDIEAKANDARIQGALSKLSLEAEYPAALETALLALAQERANLAKRLEFLGPSVRRWWKEAEADLLSRWEAVRRQVVAERSADQAEAMKELSEQMVAPAESWAAYHVARALATPFAGNSRFHPEAIHCPYSAFIRDRWPDELHQAEVEDATRQLEEKERAIAERQRRRDELEELRVSA